MSSPDSGGTEPRLPPAEVVAGGGLVHRPGNRLGTSEVLVVYRPHHGDWSFPKGKLEPGETLAECAQREVGEETGFETVRGRWVADVTYRDGRARSKVVRYWAFTVTGGSFAANEEVSRMRWVSPAGLGSVLTYRSDLRVVDRLLSGF